MTRKGDDQRFEHVAGRHLGRAPDGTHRAPYAAPAVHDPGLLVAVPRALARREIGITRDAPPPFVGFDVWNAWEASFLLANGCPVALVLTLVYPADSPNIVESKSLKLYLNSFNMERLDALDRAAAVDLFLRIVRDDLAACLGGPVRVVATPAHRDAHDARPLIRDATDWPVLEEVVDVAALAFAHDGEDPALLRAARHDGPVLRARTALLRSNCRITHQPDWGDLFVWMEGDDLPAPDALLRYVVSMRGENHFHEEIVETVWMRLWEFAPRALFVAGLYTRRGGIDISPLRASSGELIERLCDIGFSRPRRTTLRQ